MGDDFMEAAWDALRGAIDELRFAGVPVEEIRADVEKSLAWVPIKADDVKVSEDGTAEIIGGALDGTVLDTPADPPQ